MIASLCILIVSLHSKHCVSELKVKSEAQTLCVKLAVINLVYTRSLNGTGYV